MSKGVKKIIAVVIVIIIIATAYYIWQKGKGYETGIATLDDLLKSKSERKIGSTTVIVSDGEPYYALIATPITVYYDNSGKKEASPMLVSNRGNTYLQTSTGLTDPGYTTKGPVRRFIEVYDPPSVVIIGDVGDLGAGVSYTMLKPSHRDTSLDAAKYFWKSSDGVLIIKNDQRGYNLAVVATPLASYLNIPVVVADKMDSEIANVLNGFGVKYSIVCGDVEGYGKTMRFNSVEEIQDITIKIIKDRLKSKVEYITMANPLDVVPLKIINSTHTHIDSNVNDWEPQSIMIPEGWDKCLVNIQLRYKKGPYTEADGFYLAFVFGYKIGDEQFWEGYSETGAGYITPEEYIVDFDIPIFNHTGEHRLGIITNEDVSTDMSFSFDITVSRLEASVYPLMPNLSSLAPYLTAYRKGIILAKTEYAAPQAGSASGLRRNPEIAESINITNEKALTIHDEVVRLLAKLANKDPNTVIGSEEALNNLAQEYYKNPVNIGIIADTNMIPHYYYLRQGKIEEPGDTIYADINIDPSDPANDTGDGKINPKYPDVELPIGRINGWDLQDVSALLARTFFYRDIIDKFEGPPPGGGLPGFENVVKWKNAAYIFTGSARPTGVHALPAQQELVRNTLVDGGFTPYATTGPASDREHTYQLRYHAYQIQIGCSYIVGYSHGGYWLYAPSSLDDKVYSNDRGVYNVAHVQNMGFGPSTIFMVSCITGRTDGLNPRNCLSLAYLHGGMNAYLGATRGTWGYSDVDPDDENAQGAPLLAEYFTKNVMNDYTLGMALRDAKNQYLPTDAENIAFGSDIDEEMAYNIYEHYTLYGDPAFNPYEPKND